MPSFLNPTSALIAAGIVIPSLLVLYFLKLRRKEFDVPSTLLWRKAVQDLQVNSPFQRLRRNLLLILQLILLAALLMALARPVANYTPGAGKSTVILIDRSASMSARDPEYKGRSRLDEAKRRARELVSTLERNSSAMVIAFDDSADMVQPFTTDVSLLKRKIDSIQSTDRKTKLKLAYQLADAQSIFNPDQLRSTSAKPDVRLYSDGRVLDGADLSLVGNLQYEKVGTDQAGNLAVVSLSAKRNYENPNQVQIFARLANFGLVEATAQVQLSVDGQVLRVAETSLLPDRWTDKQREQAEKERGLLARDSVEFTVELTQSAVIKVEQMNKEGDCLSADDSASVIVPPPKTLSVLLVTEGNYFLEKCLNTLGLKEPATIAPAKYETLDISQYKYDVTIFDRYQPKQMPSAGAFVYFGCVPTGLKLSAEMDGAKIKLEPGVEGVLDWKRDHPILRGISLNKLYVSDPIKLVVPNEAVVLVDGMKGPLIVLYREGLRTHLVAGFDLLPSTWPLIVSFPVFMYNSMQFLAVGSDMDVRQSVDPGATPRISRTYLQKLGTELKSLQINGPNGMQKVPIPSSGDFALPALDKVGVYELSPAVPPYEKIAVNLLNASESNLLPTDGPPGGIGQALASEGQKSRVELWWWLVACLAIPLLLIEWWVYTRRVHL